MSRIFVTILLLASALGGCTSQKTVAPTSQTAATASEPEAQAAAAATGFVEPRFGEAVEPGTNMMPGPGNLQKALFAGGCFWCMEPPFDKLDGVVATVSGYAGGPERSPEYKQVAGGKTGHTEAVLVVFDPAKVSYEKLLDTFWRAHDPTDAGGQFVDRGRQYRPAIFPYDAAQREAATKARDALDASGRFERPIAAEITDAPTFWPAEDYHQDFYKKDPNHYKRYRNGSGRDQFIDRVWGDD